MEEIKLYSAQGKLIWSGFVDDKSYRLQQIMSDDNLLLYFSLPEFIEIQEEAYCDFKAERYWLPEATNYVKQHTEHFDYTLKLEGAIWMLKATKFKFFDYIIENGKIKPTSSFKLKFPITATPRMLAALIVANLRLKYPQYPWEVGECIESEPILLDYNLHFCFGVLSDAATKFETEWELDRYTLHFRKVEKMKDSAISLSYGYDKGLLGGIQRLQLDSKKIINRVYVSGDDRNIDRSTYGNDTLLLPKNKRITYEGIEYTTDASGSYLERVKPLSGQEEGLDISKHYPRRVGEVTAVEKIDDKQGLYDIIDSTIPEDLDFSKLAMAGETMVLTFQDSMTLAGKTFAFVYKHADRRFQLKPITDNGLVYPKGSLIPEVGNTYAIFKIKLPQQYIDIAENEALQDTVEFLYKNERSQNAFRFTLDGNYAKRKWGEIRGFLNCGFFINFSDDQVQTEPVKQRIVAVKEYVNDDKRPEITIANSISGKTLGSVINKIPSQEQSTDRKDREVIDFAKREFRQAQETMQMLIDAALEGFDEAIKPIAIQSMMGLFGSEALAFQYVTNKTNPVRVPSGISFNKTTKRLTCPVGIIQHQTIGLDGHTLTAIPSNKYTYWDTTQYQSDVLTEDAPYYLYLLCSKNNSAEAYYGISQKSLSAGDYPSDHLLLVGVLNKEDESGARSWVELFGMTEILPGRINTDKIVSTDGQNFLDFVNNTLKAGNLDWNVTKANQLTIQGVINALSAVLGGFSIDNDKTQSLGESNVMRIEYDDTIIPSFTDGHAGYLDKDGIIVPFDINNKDTWAYYYSDPIPILTNDRYIEFTSFQADFKQRPIVIYDNSNNAILVPPNIGQFKVDRLKIPSNATKFRICRKVENAYYNAPFVCRIFTDEKIPNIKLNGTDGSGYLAANRIMWDLFGNTSFNGKFSSNYAGNRIMIDPITRSLKFVDKRDVEIMKIWFIEQSNGWVLPRLEMKVYKPDSNNGEPLFILTMSGSGISVSYGGVSYGIGGGGFTARKSGESGNDPFSISYNSYLDKLYVKMRLPNNADGLDVGELYQSGGAVRIKT